MKIVIATNNSNKIKEIENKFRDIKEIDFLPLEKVPGIGEIIEDGETFRENALIKARTVCSASGLPAMADDSGLAVDVLSGEPGVKSARYAGEGASDSDRNLLLLRNMEGIPEEERTARFICAIAIVLPDGREFTVEGRCEGIITEAAAGNKGFGYDPLFYIPGKGKTMAEISMEEKNLLSHRARALDLAADILLPLSRGEEL